MYKFLQKYGKQIMAIASAGLMIAFIIPSASKYGGQHDTVVGKIGSEKLYNSEYFAAKQSWDILAHTSMGQGQPLASAVGPQAFQEINAHPILFLLLQKEAKRMGVTSNKDQIESIMTNMPGLMGADPDRNDRLKQALSDLLLVIDGYRRAGSAIKISQPLVEHELAQSGQSIMVSVADFSTAKYSDKVPAPTAEQPKTQFEKYADNQAGPGDAANPFGFGYKYPNRAKVQYIAIPKSDARKAVEASRTPYQWEVDSRIHYKKNLAMYPSTQAAPTNTGFSLESTSKPTTRPFEDVRNEIKDQIINQETSKRLALIQERVHATLNADWQAYKTAVGASTQPSTMPAPPTSLGQPYGSVEYLKKLAEQIQANKEFGVLPTVVSLADKWMTAEELAKTPGLGQAAMNGFPITAYAMSMGAPFIATDQQKESGVLHLLQPSPAAVDALDSVYIMRLTAAEPSHKPATLAEVEAQVKADVITQQAYAMAKADAEKLLAAAREKGLKDAAGTTPVVTAGPITAQTTQAVPGYPIAGATAARFNSEAFKLLSTATSRPSGKPVKLIELAKDGRVVVAELGDVQAMWNEKSRTLQEAHLRDQMDAELMQAFGRDWFDYDSVSKRLSYVPDAAVAEHDHPTPPAQPAMPMF